MRCSPVSSLISTLTVGSSLPTCLKTSMSFGRSLVFLASTATVTTGSEICSNPSNALIFFPGSEIVSPATAFLAPVIATMFPAGTLSVLILSGPKYTPTCWVLALPC